MAQKVTVELFDTELEAMIAACEDYLQARPLNTPFRVNMDEGRKKAQAVLSAAGMKNAYTATGGIRNEGEL